MKLPILLRTAAKRLVDSLNSFPLTNSPLCRFCQFRGGCFCRPAHSATWGVGLAPAAARDGACGGIAAARDGVWGGIPARVRTGLGNQQRFKMLRCGRASLRNSLHGDFIIQSKFLFQIDFCIIVKMIQLKKRLYKRLYKRQLCDEVASGRVIYKAAALSKLLIHLTN